MSNEMKKEMDQYKKELEANLKAQFTKDMQREFDTLMDKLARIQEALTKRMEAKA